MITFDKTEFDLGTLKYGDIGTVVSQVTNSLLVNITLEPANSSCSCTTGSITKIVLPPGETTEFKISLNTIKAGRGSNQTKSIELRYIVTGVKHLEHLVCPVRITVPHLVQ